MTLVVHSLQVVGRGLLRAYSSDIAYQAGMLLALTVGALILAVALLQHAPAAAQATVDPIEACWLFNPDCS